MYDMSHVRNSAVVALATIAMWACGSSTGSVPGGELPTLDGGAGGSSGSGGSSGGADGGGARDAATKGDAGGSSSGGNPSALQTVFLILMENHNWSTIQKSDNAKYINGLVGQGGHAEQYSTPPGNHPSELNYIWLEAGSALGITTDDPPANNHQSTTFHLSTLLDKAGITWKAYAEEVDGTSCPLTDGGKYVTRHIPFLFFDDVTGKNDPSSATCMAHVRPYGELEKDLQSGTVARYNFITPNLCDNMHGLTLACGSGNFDEIGAGDAWLSSEVPKILQSNAFKNNGVLFIVWDEGDESVLPGSKASDGPIPFFVLSPKAKVGYTSQTKLTHSSMLKTLQEIFGVTPLLGDAANATDLSEFFTSFP